MRGATCFLILSIQTKGRSLYLRLPLGGFSRRVAAQRQLGGLLRRVAAVMRGVAYNAQPIFDFLNIPEEISENQGAQLVFMKKPSRKGRLFQLLIFLHFAIRAFFTV